MHETIEDVATSDGKMNSYFFCPEEGGPFPIVVFLIDSGGVREPLADLCRRLASVGYFVAMPNLYYRKVRYLDIQVDRLTDPAYGDRLDLMWQLHHSLSVSSVMSDVRALLAHLDKNEHASKGKVGSIGYCMSGRYSYAVAGTFHDRVAAAACIYGVRYFTDEADSAHLLTPKIGAELYVAMAQHDPYVPSEMQERLRGHLKSHGVNHRLEVFEGTHHGFGLPGRHAYDRPSAERLWERLFSLYRRNLTAT
jgi:carboxymethylenebutenolidase